VYGRLLVERVEGIIDKETAKRSGDEIVQFERLLTDTNHDREVLAAHLGQGTARPLQRSRQQSAQGVEADPDDWRNREKRPQYLKALADMVEMTDQPNARWDLIAAEDKRYARVAVLETLIHRWSTTSSVAASVCPRPARATT